MMRCAKQRCAAPPAATAALHRTLLLLVLLALAGLSRGQAEPASASASTNTGTAADSAQAAAAAAPGAATAGATTSSSDGSANAPGGASAARPVVRWVNGRCEPPAAACRGANISQIPDFEGYLPLDILEGMPAVYDTARARACLSHKRVVLLGDSTTTDTFHDLALLLLGRAADKAFQKEYLAKLPSGAGAADGRFSMDGAPGEDGRPVAVTFHMPNRFPKASRNARNVTLGIARLNLTLVHRFTGAHLLDHNWEGAGSLVHPDTLPELYCLLSAPFVCGHPPPTHIVVNSGLHDIKSANMTHAELMLFGVYLDVLFGYLTALHSPLLTRTVWRSNKVDSEKGGANAKHWATGSRSQELHRLDRIAWRLAVKRGVEYYNASAVLGGYEGFSADGIHAGAISKAKSFNYPVTGSSLLTQGLLAHICGPPLATPAPGGSSGGGAAAAAAPSAASAEALQQQPQA